jgi:hypothetical protein
MSTATMTDELGGGRKRRRTVFVLGARLLAGLSLIGLLAAALDRLRDTAERAH